MKDLWYDSGMKEMPGRKWPPGFPMVRKDPDAAAKISYFVLKFIRRLVK